MHLSKRILYAGWFVLVLAGCSKVKQADGPDLQISADTLIGRWRSVPKKDFDKHGGPPENDPFENYWVFKKDHSFESMEMFGNTPANWTVTEIGRNSLAFDLTVKNFPGRVKATFESKDKCLVHLEGGGPDDELVLIRIP
jgi:hypothetical protein